jgi:hypothetical protein
VLQRVCQQCHSAPPLNSAPFPLVTYDDTQVVNNGKPIWQYMLVVLQNGTMPLPPVKIDSTDRDTLIRWLNAGAPPRLAPGGCSEPVASVDGGGGAGAVDARADDPEGEAGSDEREAGGRDGGEVLDSNDEDDGAAESTTERGGLDASADGDGAGD